MASGTGQHKGKTGRARKHRLFFVIVPVFAIIFAALLVWECMWSGEFLGKWAAAVTVLSVVGSPIAYFAKLNEKERDLRRREERGRKSVLNNLCWEMNDTLDALDTSHYLMRANRGTKSVTFTNQFLNHGVFDGLVFSGKTGFLMTAPQQQTQDIFQRVKYHNQYLQRVTELQNESSQAPFRYCEILATCEKMMRNEMPPIVRELEAESD